MWGLVSPRCPWECALRVTRPASLADALMALQRIHPAPRGPAVPSGKARQCDAAAHGLPPRRVPQTFTLMPSAWVQAALASSALSASAAECA